ncbi:MAG: DedA family protein [Desulfovibrionaceae bacterium]|nr:DedA family protein [Desulfovibrionaceae bacterium]MBF0514311.1 DedA family protein [Desulfovibrionaceae bacterium]
MEIFSQLAELVLHVDVFLKHATELYGPFIYLILFAVVFCETGLVVTPFLPGDSLLFACGALAGAGALDMHVLAPALLCAPILGDSANYLIGSRVGPAIFGREKIRFIKKEHLDQTHAFYEKHGGKAVFFARFLPILRTFSPFVAGVGNMSYPRFLAYSVTGSLCWVGLFLSAGHYFGNMAVVRRNFSLVILAIIVISVIPAVLQYLKARRAA